MKVIKRKLNHLEHTKLKGIEEFIALKRLKNKVISTYDLQDNLRKKLTYQRGKKTPSIYPVITHFSYHDKQERYPYYYYRFDDLINNYPDEIGTLFKLHPERLPELYINLLKDIYPECF